MNHVDDYLKLKRESGYLPRSIVGVCGALRLFFQFAEREGLTSQKIALAIRRPRIDRDDSKPKGPEWAAVRNMLDWDFGSTPADLRGDAILALAAIYALRSNEIMRLRLGDLDWTNEILTLRRAKSQRLQQFPLQVEVGDTILRYLKYSRPKCTCRNLFVTLKPPYRQVDPCSVWMVISRRMKKLNITSTTFGSHALRHACATQLLHQGSSLPEIAQFLGHTDLASVSIYAKHDVRALREVASVSLEAFYDNC